MFTTCIIQDLVALAAVLLHVGPVLSTHYPISRNTYLAVCRWHFSAIIDSLVARVLHFRVDATTAFSTQSVPLALPTFLQVEYELSCICFNVWLSMVVMKARILFTYTGPA
jgi:hypothetical protein